MKTLTIKRHGGKQHSFRIRCLFYSRSLSLSRNYAQRICSARKDCRATVVYAFGWFVVIDHSFWNWSLNWHNIHTPIPFGDQHVFFRICGYRYINGAIDVLI